MKRLKNLLKDPSLVVAVFVISVGLLGDALNPKHRVVAADVPTPEPTQITAEAVYPWDGVWERVPDLPEKALWACWNKGGSQRGDIYAVCMDYYWGDLFRAEGAVVYPTLTEEQAALVNYPELDPGAVYRVPKGKAFHSIEDCYTLWKSKEILCVTLDEALADNLEPCSKCVGAFEYEER